MTRFFYEKEHPRNQPTNKNNQFYNHIQKKKKSLSTQEYCQKSAMASSIATQWLTDGSCVGRTLVLASSN